jgi:hypothetical protein
VVAPFGALADAALALVGRRAPIPMKVGVEMLCQRAPLDCSPSWAALGAPRIPVRDAIADAVGWFAR